MKNNVNLKVSTEDCCGCGACANKCGVKAITMQENEEGFLYPVINEDTCTGCEQCLKVCPVLNAKSENTDNPKCYAVMASDEIRSKSSSGGMFTLLAEYILNKGGFVCGAAYDEKWNVHQIIIDKAADLDKLRSSKYMQSNTGKCYAEIEKLLKSNKEVLFSGTPCQVAGLNTFLGKKYDNLLTVEVLCHGAPSYKIFKKYLDEINIDVSDINYLNFRDKSVSWRSDYLTIDTKDGKRFQKNIPECSYEKGFHAGLYNRLSCAPCKYARLPRQADFTIADWWGISKFAPEMNDTRGTSLVLINNHKAEDIFKEIIPTFYKIKEIPLENAKKSVNVTIYRPLERHGMRKKFFNNIENMSLTKAVDICLQNHYDASLTCIWYGSNYGSILVSYSCYKILQNLGLSVLMLEKPKFIWNDNAMQPTIARKFGLRHYNVSRVYNSIDDMIYLNHHCDNFVLGSDQMFNPRLKLEHSFMEYAFSGKNKIAFGPSFGHDNYNVDPQTLERHRYLIKRFNHIALREKSKNLCHNIFDIEAEEIIDPSLICPREDFEKLADSATLDIDISQPYMLTYMLDLNPDKVAAINWIAQKLNLRIINIQNLDQRQRKNLGLEYLADYTPEQFLKLYKNASFVVTDSYHGTCFSVKFNRPFISIVNTGRGKLRYKMFEMLGVYERIVDNPAQVYERQDLLQPFDFTKTNEIIKEKTDFAVNWLKNALNNNNSAEKFSKEEICFDKQIKELRLNNLEKDNKINQLWQYKNLFENIVLISASDKTIRRYHYYKFMSYITWGEKRRKYKDKYYDLKPKVKKIRQLNNAI